MDKSYHKFILCTTKKFQNKKSRQEIGIFYFLLSKYLFVLLWHRRYGYGSIADYRRISFCYLRIFHA